MDHQFEYDEEADPIVIAPSGAALPPQPLLETVAKLRALSVLLCLDVELAEELVAITLIRAGAGFDPSHFDPNLTAWLYRRLRSYYYRDYAAQPRRPRHRHYAPSIIALRLPRSRSFPSSNARRSFSSRPRASP